MRVSIHFNLHNHKWSVTALEGQNKGRVIEHATSVYIRDCTAKVSEMQRQRVIANRCRSVHAKIVGTLCDKPETLEGFQSFSYNPFKAPGFVFTGGIWWTSRACAFVNKTALVLEPK